MLTWIKERPIASYIILTMLWSWGFWSFLLTVIKPGTLLDNPPPIAFLYIFLGGIGPSLTGIFLSAIIYGKTGIRSLLVRFKNWKVGFWWLAILIIPSITLVTPIVRYGLGYNVDFGTMRNLIIPGLMIGIIAGLMEEFGWRGFLLPELLKRFSPIKANIIIGLIWGGLWHGYADYFAYGSNFLMILLLGPIILTAWSIILTWVYSNTKQSLLLSILVHASISSSAFIFGIKYNSNTEELIFTTFSVGLALLAACVILMNKKTLAKRLPFWRFK